MTYILADNSQRNKLLLNVMTTDFQHLLLLSRL